MKYRIVLFIIVLVLFASNTGCSNNNRGEIASLLTDERGNTYAVWRMVRSVGDHDVHLTKINSSGEVLWDKSLFIGDDKRVNILGLAGNNKGGVFVSWEVLIPEEGKEGRHYFDRSMLVNVDEQGVITMNRDFSLQGMQMQADGCGGLLLGWNTREYSVVERVDDHGVTLWKYQTEDSAVYQQFIAGNDGESFILTQKSDESYMEIQKINSDGQVVWGNHENITGIRINGIDANMNPIMVSDNLGGLIVCWLSPLTDGNGSNIRTYRVNAYGENLYDNTVGELVMPPSEKIRAISDGAGGSFIVWEDHRSGMALYAQKVNGEGKPLWQNNGVAVCTGLPAYSPRFNAISDSANGIIVIWRDGNSRIGAQRLDAFGQSQWGDMGIQIGENACDVPILVSGDEQGRITIGWATGNNEYSPQKSYVQMLNSAGDLLWGNSGIKLSVVNG